MSSRIYDAYWESGMHLTKEWTPDFFEESLGVLKGKKCVLDYGCGFGYSYQRPLSQSIQKYIGADVSAKALENARSKGLGAVTISDQGKIEIPDGACDGAVCSEVFEHLWDPLAAARELYRVLEPGGVLVATVPNFGYFAWRLLALLRAQVPLEPETTQNRYKGVHIRFFSQLMLTRLLQDAGFKSVQVHGWCGCSIWHVFRCAGPFGKISAWADRNLPAMLHFKFLARAWPNVCAERLRVVAIK
jgi:SAM-dependent methyltransferase